MNSSPVDPNSADAVETRSPVTVFAPGDEKLPDELLQSLGPDRAPSRSAAAVQRATILMVDDEMLNIEMTEAFLSDAGYASFVWTEDSRRALDLMRRHHPGVVLLDLSMPHVGGLEILDEMRRSPDLRHMPVIVLTSTTDPQVKLQCLSAGAMDFLSKPVDPSELALRIRNTLAATAYREFLARHDPLTGLPNTSQYKAELKAAIEHAAAAGTAGAVIHLGVDKLGPINDVFGRDSGDSVVQRLGKRLASSVATEEDGDLASGPASPKLFRFDGDEFAVLVPNVEAQDVFAAFISKLMEDAAFALHRGNKEVFVTSGMGIAVFPQDGATADELVTNAGLALRQAKHGGTHQYEFFARQFNQQAADRLRAGADLGRAFARNEIELVYHPIVDAKTGRLYAGEAVVQWRRPGGPVVSGAELMALGGTSDMALAITEWTLEQVTQNSKRWSSAGLKLVPLVVSLSLAHVDMAGLPEVLRNAIRGGLVPPGIVLQLQNLPPESKLGGPDVDVLSELQSWGFRLALDQFGTGACSMLALRRIRADVLRVAPAFVEDLQDPRAAATTRALLAMLKSFGVPVIVPGVDTPAQLDFARQAGAEHCQGRHCGGVHRSLDFAAQWLSRAGGRVS